MLKAAVHAIKLNGARMSIPLLVPFLCDIWRMFESDSADYVIPIPLHVWRLRERGFNQAALFAKGVAEIIEKPLLTDVLLRVRETRVQGTLEREERLTNIKGAFFCCSSDALVGASVLLVDDVCTTGATLECAARALRDAGARKVSALTLAHG